MRTASIRTAGIVRLNKRGYEFEAYVTEQHGGSVDDRR